MNSSTNKIDLISLPRDLYYKGSKINLVYKTYGPEIFIKEIKEITGLDISNYIIIDMFAFIDVVNILGGIDIELKNDLIDPTYKIKDNGRWSTLYYKKGKYHLGGIETLRLARSRHYSSDFGRAERQQQIIVSLINKFKEFDIKEAGKLYDLIKVLIHYVDTDLTPFDIVNLFKNYKDSELAGKTILNTDNVLYNTYSNMIYLKDKEVADNFYRGEWILLPIRDDWNVIRWYIRTLIEK